MIRFSISFITSLVLVWSAFRWMAHHAVSDMATVTLSRVPAAIDENPVQPPHSSARTTEKRQVAAPSMDDAHAGQDLSVPQSHQNLARPRSTEPGGEGLGRQVVIDASAIDRLDSWISDGSCDVVWLAADTTRTQPAIVWLSAGGVRRGDHGVVQEFQKDEAGTRIQLDTGSPLASLLAKRMDLRERSNGSVTLLCRRLRASSTEQVASTLHLSVDETGNASLR